VGKLVRFSSSGFFTTRSDVLILAVHRLSATLALLLFQSPFFSEVASLLEVLETKDVISRRRGTVKATTVEAKEKEGVLAVMKDLETLLEQV
jgi:hypothetical protein